MKSATVKLLRSIVDEYKKQRAIKDENFSAHYQHLLRAVSDQVFEQCVGALTQANHTSGVEYHTGQSAPWLTVRTTSPAGYSSSLTVVCEPRGLVLYKVVSGPASPRGAENSELLPAGSDIEEKAAEFVQEVLEADVLTRVTP